MDVDELKRLLQQSAPLEGEPIEDFESEPVSITPEQLDGLSAADLPIGVRVQVARVRDGVHHIELDGCLVRGTKTPLTFEMSPSWYRKYWAAPLGMTEYLDLVRRAIETRERIRGDVHLGAFDNDDDPWIHIYYSIESRTDSLAKAYAEAKRVDAELAEVAESVAREVGLLVASAVQRLSGWGNDTLELLVEQVESQKTADSKGRVLEEICCRLLETVPGFKVGGRVRTQTEEIDVSVINGSDDHIWKRETALILAECKNWSSKCGKDEFVIFQEKLRNRRSRCSCGLFVSWNGFAQTVTREMLRGSAGDLLVIPIAGKDIREAVRDGSFPGVLERLWKESTLL
jgi:hypothetical protein